MQYCATRNLGIKKVVKKSVEYHIVMSNLVAVLGYDVLLIHNFSTSI